MKMIIKTFEYDYDFLFDVLKNLSARALKNNNSHLKNNQK